MRIARSTGAISGLLIALLAVWGALIAFVGPYFDYSFGVNSAWHYTADRLWLNILPGAVALAGGLLLLTAATRRAGVLGGSLAILAGAWFAIGPAVSLTWESGPGPIGPPLFDPTRQTLELIGYFYGLGAAIVVLAGFAIGRLVPARVVTGAPAATPAELPGAPLAAPAGPGSGAPRSAAAPPARVAGQPAPGRTAPGEPVRQRGRFAFRRRRGASTPAGRGERTPS